MKTVATVNVVIFVIVISIAMYIGLDPKKWQIWLLSLYGFLTFFLAGIVGTGNFYESIIIGAIATFALIFGGIIEYWNRERAKNWLREQEKEEEESYRKLP
jgi:Na+/H+ antiporter NhaD/arsenite permease-like protein